MIPKEQQFSVRGEGSQSSTGAGVSIAGRVEAVQRSEWPPHDRTGPATTHTGSAGSWACFKCFGRLPLSQKSIPAEVTTGKPEAFGHHKKQLVVLTWSPGDTEKDQ